MKNLPNSSSTDYVSGVWFVHHGPGVIIRVWLSLLNGKEKIYANEDLVAEKRNITRLTTLHTFEYQGSLFDVEVYVNNLIMMEMQCNIFKDGDLIDAQVYGFLPNGSYGVRENEKSEPIIRRALGRFHQKGIQELNEYDLESAQSFFRKALNIRSNDPETFFLLACIASLEEKKEEAYEKLEKALEYGLQGKDRILKEDKLAYVRIQPEFDAFLAKHFGNPKP